MNDQSRPHLVYQPADAQAIADVAIVVAEVRSLSVEASEGRSVAVRTEEVLPHVVVDAVYNPTERLQLACAPDGTGASVVRPARRNEPDHGIHLAPIRQRIGSVFRTCKELLSLERHMHVRRATSSPGSRLGCSPSLPASASTTSSVVPAECPPTTPRRRVASII